MCLLPVKAIEINGFDTRGFLKSFVFLIYLFIVVIQVIL